MSKARFILVVLICATPAILIIGGLTVDALVAGAVAAALVITGRNLRPGETEFLISLMRPWTAVAAIPALWIVIQVLPLTVFRHPIWISVEEALGHPIAGAISVDPGASVVALSQYFSMFAVVFLSAAIAVDRQRATWLLFALTAACTATALIVLSRGWLFPEYRFAAFKWAQAVDCTNIGAIIAAAACLRTIERYQARSSSQQRSVAILLWTLAASSAALAICAAASAVDATYWTIFADACGLVSFACLWIVRRFAIRPLGGMMIAAAVLGIAILLIAANPAERGRSVSLAFVAAPSSAVVALNERMLDDAPLAGAGAGSFTALAQIYREIDDPLPSPTAATTAAALAIELGKPMLWILIAATVAAIIMLLKASLERGRDSFYPAMAASSLITLLLLAFANAGLLGTATGLIAAAAFGLGFAQRKGRRA